MKKLSYLGALLAAPLLVLSLLPSLAFAEGFMLKDPILEEKGIKYAETGVAESKEDPRWKEGNALILEFATKHSELYADVAVTIKNEKDKRIFEHTVKSPWLVLWLKPGTYQVEMKDSKGRKQSAKIEVGSKHQMKTFKW